MGYDLEGDYRSGFGNSRRGRREWDESIKRCSKDTPGK